MSSMDMTSHGSNVMVKPCSKVGAAVIDTRINRLGEARYASPLVCEFDDIALEFPAFLDAEYIGSLAKDGPVPVCFELAGPREKIYFPTGKTTCAVVTCGGLCPGLNDVIRAIVMEAHYHYAVPHVLGLPYGLEGLVPNYGHDPIKLTPHSVADIHNFGGTVLGSSRGPQDPAAMVDYLQTLGVDILFMIGGDGTMRAMNAITEEASKRQIELAVVGIPKTIDNDISFVPQSFGFETAVCKATEAIQCAHVEARGSTYGVGLVKLMGRESGFIAAHATMAMKEVNFVLIPESPFALEGEGALLPALVQRLKERKHAVIVLAEGAGQDLLERSAATDASGNRVLGDIASLLRAEITRYCAAHGVPCSIKYIDPSYIIRAVPADATDKVYCGLLGQRAVHAGMAGCTNMVVAKIMDKYVHLPLHLVTQKRRRLSTKSSFWRAVLESTGQDASLGCPV